MFDGSRFADAGSILDQKAPDLLSQGFYTVPEAARLIRVGNARRIYGWLKGYPGRQTGPLLVRDYQPLHNVQELSFLDLMEVRFVEHFREYGVKVGTLRRAAARLREELNTSHPFAQEQLHFVADRADVLVREVFAESAKEEGDARFRSLLTNNYVMYEAIKQSLLPGVAFDPVSRLATWWRPRPTEFAGVLVNPKVAFGQPSIGKGVPTATLRRAWEAEKHDTDAVAYWYEVSTLEVMEAVRFEQSLDKDKEQRAA